LALRKLMATMAHELSPLRRRIIIRPHVKIFNSGTLDPSTPKRIWLESIFDAKVHMFYTTPIYFLT
jgi:hypothetical protein